VITLRVYEELNDYLPRERRKRDFLVPLAAGATVSDVLAGEGIPPDAVDLVLAAGRPVGLDHPLRDGERVAAYPVFEALDLGGVSPIPGRPLRHLSFFADEHLARLARHLRLAGFDTLLAPGIGDHALVARAEAEGRILLTRDRHLVNFLKPSRVFVPCSERPLEQFMEVVGRLQLEAAAAPFTRCLVCNTPLESCGRRACAGRVPETVLAEHDAFLRCAGCGRVYWPGSHYRRMRRILAAAGIEAG
jgi:uncharacterized protein with PIN domain